MVSVGAAGVLATAVVVGRGVLVVVGSVQQVAVGTLAVRLHVVVAIHVRWTKLQKYTAKNQTDAQVNRFD